MKTLLPTLLLLPAVTLSSATLLACGDKDGDTGHDDEHGAEACEAAGTGEDLTASADVASAPVLHTDEGAVVALTSGEVGYVALQVEEAGDYLLAAGTADVVADLWQGDTALGLGASAALDACPDDVLAHWDVELEAGDYVLELGPAAVDSVWVGVFPLDHEGEDHDDHDH